MRYKCKNCGKEVCLTDKYCKCGEPINDVTVEPMQETPEMIASGSKHEGMPESMHKPEDMLGERSVPEKEFSSIPKRRKELAFAGLLIGVFCISFLGARFISGKMGGSPSSDNNEYYNQPFKITSKPENEDNVGAAANISGEVSSVPEYEATSSTTPEPTRTPEPTFTPTPEPTPTPTPLPEHRYKIVLADVTWEEARARCLESGEKNAQLATFETAEELEEVCRQIVEEGKEEGRFFIGARRSSDSRSYYWVDRENLFVGDPINDKSSSMYEYWMRGEPSFEDAGQSPAVTEDKVDFCFFESENRFVINDVPNDVISIVPQWAGRVGYILEYEAE